MAVDPPDTMLRRLQQVAGAMLAALGGIVIVGRLADVFPLVTLVPDGVPMAFVTAADAKPARDVPASRI